MMRGIPVTSILRMNVIFLHSCISAFRYQNDFNIEYVFADIIFYASYKISGFNERLLKSFLNSDLRYFNDKMRVDYYFKSK